MDLATETTIHLVTAIPGPRSAELQKRREASVPRGVGSVLPIWVQRASGATVEDVDGNRLLDFTGGIGCRNAGHVPPETLSAIREQAQRFIHTCFSRVYKYQPETVVIRMLSTLRSVSHRGGPGSSARAHSSLASG